MASFGRKSKPTHPETVQVDTEEGVPVIATIPVSDPEPANVPVNPRSLHTHDDEW